MKDIQQLQKEYRNFLEKFITFKTVSTDSSFQSDILSAVDWLSQLFTSKGFIVSILKGEKTNPVIVAKYIADPDAKTVMVYGHYDVQPAHLSEGWATDPFVLTEKDGRLYARGVVDNKGQILAQMVGVFDAIDKKALKTNVIFLIEGNEESENDELAGLLEEYKKDLPCDLIMISDGEMVGEYPTLDLSYRGGGNIKVTYETANNDRHSGLFGGAIPNAIFELATLLSKLKSNNSVAFKEFYSGTVDVSQQLRTQHEKLSELQALDTLAGVKALLTEPGVSAYEQVGLRPTLEVSGFSGGYCGNGFKNIVPGKAEVRINVRTVYPQNTAVVMQSIHDFIIQETPKYVSVNVVCDSHGDPISLDAEHPDLSEVKNLLADVHGKEVLYRSVGGSIPVIADLQKVFNVPIAMVSLCNDDCNMHGVDENFSSYHLKKALEFTSRYWKSI